LIAKLTNQTYITSVDKTYVEVFMLTYRSFINPNDLFELLMYRFDCPPQKEIEKEEEFLNFKIDVLMPIRHRISIVMKNWIENHYYDFLEYEDLKEKFDDFIHKVLKKTEMDIISQDLGYYLKKYLTELQKIADKEKEMKEESNRGFLAFAKDQTVLNVIKMKNNNSLIPTLTKTQQQKGEGYESIDFYCWSEVEIARQLTLIDFEFFSRIQPKGLFNI
jgi:son of sevenless